MILNRAEIDRVNRIERTYVNAGGKGLNVARAVRRLGGESRILGFSGGWTAPFLREECTRLGIDDRLTEISEPVRVCAIIVEVEPDLTTVYNEPGPPITRDDVDRLGEELRGALPDSSCLVISGSLPPGVDPGFYEEVIEEARARDVRVLLDTSGDALRSGIGAGPWMATPNGEEVEAIVEAFDPHIPLVEWASACRVLHRVGAENLALSAGERGAVFSDGELLRVVGAPEVTQVNPTGSGDAMVAGIAMGITQGLDPLAAIRLGVGCGALNAERFEPDLPEGIHISTVIESATVTDVVPLVKPRGAAGAPTADARTRTDGGRE